MSSFVKTKISCIICNMHRWPAIVSIWNSTWYYFCTRSRLPASTYDRK